MKNWKRIAITLGISTAAFLSYASVSWQGDPAANVQSVDSQSFPPEIATSPQPETALVPAGTRIDIRLQETISSKNNSPGDLFTASLRGPLIVDVKLLAPSRCKIIGQITNVKELDRTNQIAHLTIELRKLIVAGKEYDLETNPVTLVVRNGKKKDSAMVEDGAATGQTIGAITGISKGIVIGPETRFTFTLSGPLELPVIRTMGNSS